MAPLSEGSPQGETLERGGGEAITQLANWLTGKVPYKHIGVSFMQKRKSQVLRFLLCRFTGHFAQVAIHFNGDFLDPLFVTRTVFLDDIASESFQN